MKPHITMQIPINYVSCILNNKNRLNISAMHERFIYRFLHWNHFTASDTLICTNDEMTVAIKDTLF